MKRFVFDNLIYKYNDEAFLIMNLISFRREIITKNILDRLISIESKFEAGQGLSCEEENFLEHFLEKNRYYRQRL